MNKLEVGMYVRTEIGEITKIEKLTLPEEPSDCLFVKFENESYSFKYKSWETIDFKSSHNIIDLIEVGDIISYEYPTGLGMIGYENVTILPELLNTLQNGENNHEYKIKSIVTKEQFEAMEYKVESEVK